MKSFIAALCVIFVLSLTMPVHADKGAEPPEGVGESSYGYHPPMQRKSVATAALLSVLPSFGAGLYYAEEYPMAISSTVGMAVGLGLFLDAQLRTHRSSQKVSAITIMGSTWLLGVVYAPLSVHQRNKTLDELYGLHPSIGISHKGFYASIGKQF